MGLDFGEYLKKIKKTEEELRGEWKEKAEERARQGLVLQELAKQEKIEVAEEEIEAEINKTIKHYPDWEMVKAQIDMGQLKEYTKGRLKNEKVFELLESL
jgi:trigger factor